MGFGSLAEYSCQSFAEGKEIMNTDLNEECTITFGQTFI